MESPARKSQPRHWMFAGNGNAFYTLQEGQKSTRMEPLSVLLGEKMRKNSAERQKTTRIRSGDNDAAIPGIE